MLLNSINDFKDKNFAYFCKFDEKRVDGNEYLFISDKKAVNIYNNAIEHLNKLKLDDKLIPLYLSYDFIDDIYPDIKIKRSSWPELSYIVPDKIYTSKIKRDNKKLNVKNEGMVDDKLSKKIGILIDRIKGGDLLQIVISKRFDLDDYDVINLLKKFIFYDKSLYVYYYKFDDYEIIGSSPENLFTVNGNSISIDPIAGTRKIGKTEIEDKKLESELKNDEKELLEHRMLVDLARNDIGKICIPGTVRVTKSMEIQKFSTVQHMVSNVTGILRDNNTGDIFRAIFPAGTVSGAPKKKAIMLIDETEDLPRGAYAGSLGVISRNYIDMALLIRSLYRNRDENYTQAGAGIVKDSIPENEVNEMYSKVLSVTGDLYEKIIDY